MLVRSDDGQWRYSIPLMFVNRVSQGTFHPVVYLNMQPDELVHYVVEAIPEAERGRAATRPRTDERAPAASPLVGAGAGAPAEQAAEAQPPAADEDLVLSMPVAYEELVVRKEPSVLGRIRVHKGVETEERHVSLPVYHEEAIIEHIAPDKYDRKAYTNPNEVIIPIVEERLVVQKQVVVKEYLRVKKMLVTQHDEVHETLRRETVTVTEMRQPGLDPRYGALLRGATDEGVSGNGHAADGARDGARNGANAGPGETTELPDGLGAPGDPDLSDQPTITDMRTDSMPPA